MDGEYSFARRLVQLVACPRLNRSQTAIIKAFQPAEPPAHCGVLGHHHNRRADFLLRYLLDACIPMFVLLMLSSTLTTT